MNMSYCRFQNTLADLRDCYENMDDGDMSADEQHARKRLIQLCMEIAANCKEFAEDAPANPEADRYAAARHEYTAERRIDEYAAYQREQD